MTYQINPEKNIPQTKVVKIAKSMICIYLLIPYILFILRVFLRPYFLSEYLRWMMSDWYYPVYLYIVLIIYWSPVLIIIGGVSYFAKMSNLSRIPLNSSIYDAITLPTIQYGPIKIIFPSEEEESPEENGV
ncbi:MAG: hypothetical protein ACFFDC_01450 [Promethearchaeota archaeon]